MRQRRLYVGLCKGLDYFSIDSYQDGAGEASAVLELYERSLFPKLRGPNPWEPRGQGLWFVPGLYFTCAGPSIPGKNGTHSPCKGGSLKKTPASIMAKMSEYWKLAQSSPHIVGINPWHWLDRPTMSPAEFRRGAETMGPQLLELLAQIGGALRNHRVSQND